METESTAHTHGMSIRQRRQALRLTQSQLANESAVSLSSVRNLETGVRPVSDRSAGHVLAALDRLERSPSGTTSVKVFIAGPLVEVKADGAWTFTPG